MTSCYEHDILYQVNCGSRKEMLKKKDLNYEMRVLFWCFSVLVCLSACNCASGCSKICIWLTNCEHYFWLCLWQIESSYLLFSSSKVFFDSSKWWITPKNLETFFVPLIVQSLLSLLPFAASACKWLWDSHLCELLFNWVITLLGCMPCVQER